MEKLFASWALMSRSFRILKADKELMWLPVLSAVSSLLVTAALASGGAALFYPSIRAILDAGSQWRPSPDILIGVSFVFYLANYFVIGFFNTALVAAASIRLQGGDPTLGDGLRLAWHRAGVILQWALLAATVGMVLQMIEERASIIGRLVAGLVGLAWTLASFLVVPVLAFENVGPVEALRRSAELFRKTWGEQVAGAFSFGLVTFFLAVLGLVLPLTGNALAGQPGLVTGACLYVIYVLLLSVAASAARGIFIAALYRYATTGEVAPGFRRQNLSSAWTPKRAR